MSKKGAKGGKQNEFLQPTKEVLRGIILADSFDQKFVPITRQAPRALLPLVNVPLLDYTIEFLASAGVEEIFVFCCAHAKMIQDYLRFGYYGCIKCISESKWNHTPGLTIRPVVSYTSLSAGDALREMYNLDLIDSDFILVSGDLVANMRLDKVLAAHKARRQKDKNCIMTMVLKKAEPNHRTRSLQDDVVVAIDKPTGKLLYFDNDPTSNSVDIDLEVYKSHSEVQIRYDLLDCRIDICSPEVLYLFADNFDYQELRQDFVRGIITSEILGNKMYTHVISGEYAARVKDLRTYDAVSKDIIHRWAYPLVPDNNFMGNTSFKYLRNSIYLENNVKLSRSCTVHEECAIGEGTEIGDKTNIYHSVIGRNCKIGNNVVIKGCYIWNDVTIGDNVVVKKSIICNGAKILSDSVVQKGCLISFDVVVGPNFTVPSLTKLTTYIPTTTTPKIGHKTEGSDFEDQDIDSDNEFTEDDRDALQDIDLGEQGFGRLWQEKSDYDPITNSLIGYELLKKSLQVSPGSGLRGSPLPKALVPQKADSKGSGVSFDDEMSKFEKEARDMVHSSVIANHHLDNVVLEINGLKYAYNTTFSDCAVIILQTLLDEAKDEKPDVLMKSIQKILQRWSGLLLKFVTSSDDQVEVIWALQAFCEKPEKKQFKTVFPLILHKLYELEIIEEDAVWSWEKASKGSEENFVQLSEKFLTWLKEAEEEEDEDEDEEDEEEEEE